MPTLFLSYLRRENNDSFLFLLHFCPLGVCNGSVFARGSCAKDDGPSSSRSLNGERETQKGWGLVWGDGEQIDGTQEESVCEREREHIKEWKEKGGPWVGWSSQNPICYASAVEPGISSWGSHTRLHLCVFGDDVIVRNAHTHSLKSLERFLANSPILGITLASFSFTHLSGVFFFFFFFFPSISLSLVGVLLLYSFESILESRLFV